ncbi:hypothetical protein KEJ15_08605 [Candidatus Bathyarchaeota archaeon]|nr:hypothetical protein [Candidatus Bathyarchaeota archaeon]
MAILATSVFASIQAHTVKAATTDVAIKAVIGYPLIENLPEPGTPPHNIWIGVGLLNEGTTDVYCDVTIYFNSTPRLYINGFFLGANTFTAAKAYVNTATLGKGRHVISAHVAVAGDQDPYDNYMIGDTVKVGRIADVNYDGIVNIFDIAAISVLYGLGPCTLDPIWIPEIDVNRDGRINMYDIAYYAARMDYYNITRAIVSCWSTGVHGPTAEWNWACDLHRDGVIDGLDIAIASKHYGEHDP